MSIQCPSCRSFSPDDADFCGKCSAPLVLKNPPVEAPTRTSDLRVQGLKTGRVLAGRYEIIECLGEGGMGRVYKAYDLEVGEEVALKLIRPEIAADPRVVQRFQNELKLTRKISHRNVCRVFDLGKDGPALFISMEYVPGEDLRTTIHRIGPMNVRKTLDIGKQICQGLSEAHAQGVIHRDLKPGNIIIDRDGNVRILDFGIALSRQTEGVTDAGVVPGTFHYVAPELLGGAKPSPSSDIFSLGVILYEMVTGRLPGEKGPAHGPSGRPSGGMLKEPTAFNHEIPAALSRLILKCLENDPAKRLSKAEDVCAELSRIEGELPAPEEGAGPGRWRGKLKFKPSWLWALAVGVPLAAAALFFGLGRGGASPPRSSNQSLLVLPFRHLNVREGERNLTTAALDRLIRNLSNSPELEVVPYEKSVPFRDSLLPDAEIEKRQEAGNLLKGTITSTAAGMDIDVKLLRQPGGEVLWAQSYAAKSEIEFYGALDRIAMNVGEKLGSAVHEHIKPAPSDPQANLYYSYGLASQQEYFQTYRSKDFKSCIDFYRKALDIEPGSAIIHWQLGAIYETRFNRDKNAADETQMIGNWEKAYAINPNLAEANLGKGWIQFNREEHDQAYLFFKKAMEIDGASAEVNVHVGSYLRSLGLYHQARRHYEKALALMPVPGDFATWHRLLADCDSQLGNVREAADLFRRAMELKSNPDITLDLAVCLLKQNDLDEAGRLIAEAVRLGADVEQVRRHQALWRAAEGNGKAARELLKSEPDPSHHLVTSAYALLGMRDRALQGIRAASGSEGFRRYRWYRYSYLPLKNNPFFEKLREDPEFKSILQGEATRYEERVKKFGDL